MTPDPPSKRQSTTPKDLSKLAAAAPVPSAARQESAPARLSEIIDHVLPKPDDWPLNDFAMFLRTTELKPRKNNFMDVDIEQLAEIFDKIPISMRPMIASAYADEGEIVLQDVDSASAQLNEFLPDVVRAFEAHGEAFRSERHRWGIAGASLGHRWGIAGASLGKTCRKT